MNAEIFTMFFKDTNMNGETLEGLGFKKRKSSRWGWVFLIVSKTNYIILEYYER